MDTNLTGAIATIVTLNQSWFSGSIPLLVGAILGAILTGGITLYRDKINNKRNNDNLLIQTYSKLIGEKFVLCQSYENILSISIDIDYKSIPINLSFQARLYKPLFIASPILAGF